MDTSTVAPTYESPPVLDDGRLYIKLHEEQEFHSSSTSLKTSSEEEKIPALLNGNPGVAPKAYDDEHARNSFDEPTKTTKRKKLRSIGHRAKQKTKRLLHVGNGQDHVEKVEGRTDSHHIRHLDDNAAFGPPSVVHKEPLTLSNVADKARSAAITAAHTVAHPRKSAKEKAAGLLAFGSEPYLDHEADCELLHAHDQLSRARSNENPASEEDSDLEWWQEKVDSLEARRESKKVAYTTSRHIQRVRVVPESQFVFMEKAEFYARNEDGSRGRFQYGRFLRYLFLEDGSDVQQLLCQRDTLLSLLERIVIASAPWQSWFAGLRHIYRWEDPRLTLKWFAVWIVIWYFQYVMTFIEMVRRHGDEGWIDPLLEQMGPWLQIQVPVNLQVPQIELTEYSDISSNPCGGSGGIYPLTVSPHDKRIYFEVWYTDYNQAEWSFMYLRRKAQETRADLIAHQVERTYTAQGDGATAAPVVASLDLPDPAHTKPVIGFDSDDDSDSSSASYQTADSSTSILGGMDIMSFRCRSGATPGRLVICSTGLRFVRASPLSSRRKELWRCAFHELAELRKVDAAKVAKVIGAQGIELDLLNRGTVRLDAVKGRDRAFNSILGFSGLQWQVLQSMDGGAGKGAGRTQLNNEAVGGANDALQMPQ
ncbi:hypothetical protein LTR66_008929 [Elasticomyces elasticus]|nr:hypothetical protein LTR66_008929 [Elasticomyces elasticus]